jgi:hypothetical protein
LNYASWYDVLMPQFQINTKYGSYLIEADRAPTQEEAEQIAYAQTRNNTQPTEMDQDDDRSMINKGVDIFLDTIPALVGGFVGGRIAGSAGARKGATIGATSAGTLSNWLKQNLQIDRGDRNKFQGGELAAAAISSVPFLSISPIGKSINNRVLRAGLTAGGEGAVLATSAEAVRSAFDEGRLPDVVDLSKQAAAGFLLGGAAGSVLSKYARDGALISNPVIASAGQVATAGGAGLYAYDELKEKGDSAALPKALGISMLVYGGTKIPSALAQAGGTKARLTTLGPESVVGKGATSEIRTAEDARKGIRAEADAIGGFINTEVMKQPNPEQAARDVFSALEGGGGVSLPSNLQKYVDRARDLRIKNTDDLLFHYQHLEDEDVLKKIYAQRGTYLTRGYRAHIQNKGFKAGVDYDTPADRAVYKQELIDDIINQDPTVSVADATNQADAKMTRMLGDVGYVTSGDVSPSQRGSLSKKLGLRTDISPAGRKWLGEIRDPGRAIADTLDTQGSLIVTQERDKAVVKLLKTSGLASLSKRNETDQLMTLSEGSVLHPEFEGLFASPEVNSALKEMFSPNILGDNKILGGWLELSGLSKATKTVLNPLESIVPQIYGGLALAASSWKANPRYVIDAIRRITFVSAGKIGKSLSADEKINQAAELKKLTSYGLIGNSYDVQELRTLFRLSGEGKSYKDVINKFSKVYSSPDAVFRYAIWKSNVDELKSFEKGPITQDRLIQIEKKAADITNDQFPTYSRVSRRYRQASAVGLANAFGAFEFEVIRNSINQVQYARNLIQEGKQIGNSAMVMAGLKRIMGFAAVGGVTAGLGSYTSRTLGVSKDEEEAMKVIMPSYDKDKALVVAKTPEGNIWYAPLNYLAPHSNAIGAIGQLAGNGDPIPALRSMFFGADFGPLATPFIEALTNSYYKTNVPITLPRDNTDLLLRALNNAFMPGSISGTLERARKASAGQTNALGMVSTWGDVVKRIGGIRGNTGDPTRLAEIAAKDAVDKVVAIQAGYRRILNQTSSRGGQGLSGLNESRLYNQRNEQYISAQVELGKIYAAMKTLQKTMPNITDASIISAFENAGISRKLILGAAMNSPIPMNRGLGQTNSEFFEQLAAGDPKQVDLLIRARAGDSSSERRKLSSEYREYTREIRSGKKDPIASLFAGMGIADGERAKNIFYVTRNFSQGDRNDFYRRLRSRDILTPEVARQLREFERRAAQANQ